MGIRLICGKTRAGKTTYSQRYEKVIHLDDYGGEFCYQGVLKVVADRLDDIVIEGIYNTAERRKALLNAYKGKGERVCIWLDTPLEIIKSRIHTRWLEKCLPQLFDFEPPTLDEGWDEIVVIRGDSDGRV